MFGIDGVNQTWFLNGCVLIEEGLGHRDAQLRAHRKLDDGRTVGSNTEVGIRAIDDIAGIGVAAFASSITFDDAGLSTAVMLL